MKSQCDVVVIGAGAGGLASALRLAKNGKKVCVYEAMEGPGGKIGTSIFEGVEFDTGPSLLTMREHVEELFDYCGTTMEAELELVEHEPGFRYLWTDGAKFDVYPDVERTRQDVRESFGSKALDEFDAFLSYSKNIWEAALPNFVEGEAPSFGSILKLGVTKLKEVSRIDPFRSMLQGIERHISEPHLRDVMMRYATYNGSNALSAPATLNCIAWVELGLGGYGIRGGMSALPLALERVGKRLGVEFYYGHRVESIVVDPKRGVEGVKVRTPQGDTNVVRATKVVVNADVAHLKQSLLGEDVHHGMGEDLTPSMSGWTAILKARAREDRASHTVLFPERYRDEFEDIFERNRPPKTPTIYMCDQSKAHGREGWDDGTVPVFVMANAPCEPREERTQADEYWSRYREVVTQRMREFQLMKEGEEIVWERTPTQLATQFPGSRGAIYGAASNTQTAAFKRPANRVKSIKGLYLASGSAHPGGGVPLCLLSGKVAAESALGDR